ncbi:MAG: DUF2064 domain-containing protein [Tenacibaculum sp.]
MQKPKVVVLIFANTSAREILNKSFTKNQKLFGYLNKKTIATAKKSRAQLMFCDETLQKGKNFAEKFACDIDGVFKKGYQHIIAIGNHSPGLKTKHIAFIINALQKGHSVIGFSLDGGVYLIGITKKQFNKQEFLNLPWQTNLLLNCLEKALFSKTFIVKKLEYLKDIDNYNDLKYFINNYSFSNSLKKLLVQLVSFSKNIFAKNTAKLLFYWTVFCFYNKGSPFSLYLFNNHT